MAYELLRARCESSFDLVSPRLIGPVKPVAGQRTLRVLRRLTMNNE